MGRMRVAWTSPQTLPITANAGLGMLMTNQKSWEEYREDVRGFNAVRVDHGWAPIQPSVVVHVACFDTEEEAWDVILSHRPRRRSASSGTTAGRTRTAFVRPGATSSTPSSASW